MAEDAAAPQSRDQRIVAWMNARDEATAAVALEQKLRVELFRELFPEPEEGTNTFELPNDWQVKGVHKLSYSLNNAEKNGFLTKRALEAMSKLGPSSAVAAGRLVRWSPELSITEYKRLTDAERLCIEGGDKPALTIKPSMPSLEVKPPAGWQPPR